MSIPLSAGPIQLVFQPEDGMIRSLSFAGREFLQGVYAAVRDRHWGTVRPRLVITEQTQTTNGFTLRFSAECLDEPIDFYWSGEVQGDSQGTIVYTFKGVARRRFRKNRIGFCVLHSAELAGHPCRVQHVDGRWSSGCFPRQISPHQPFRAIRAIEHEVEPGCAVRVEMTGDVFEMEDQRNWTDASFKTYGTPLNRPFPVWIKQGQTVEQEVRITWPQGLPGRFSPKTGPAGPIAIRCCGEALPLASVGAVWNLPRRHFPSNYGWEMLQQAGWSHLRVDLCPSRRGWKNRLSAAMAAARRLTAALEIALFLTDDAVRELNAVADVLYFSKLRPEIARWLIFPEQALAVPDQLLSTARRLLHAAGLEGAISGGTDGYFAELNRHPPRPQDVDAVVYSINPQVHTFDDLSLLQTLPMQALTIAEARRLAAGKAVCVSPLTFKPRRTALERRRGKTTAGRLPAAVDVRQCSAFGAVWTLGSLKHALEAGAQSLTYFEAVGWTGLMERPEGSPLPEAFPSRPGELFPLFHVFSWLGAYREARCLPSISSHPLQVEALVLQTPEQRVALLANYTRETQKVSFADAGAGKVQICCLDFAVEAGYATLPDLWIHLPRKTVKTIGGACTLTMPAHSLVEIQVALPGEISTGL